MTDLLSRITKNPNIAFGKPTIRETRYTVVSILEYLAAGDSIDEILITFPELHRDDILACIAYALAILKERTV